MAMASIDILVYQRLFPIISQLFAKIEEYIYIYNYINV